MGYGEAPWVFKGRALYQLQLVKTEEARKHIPAEFKLVELFGYTLGGFYLARYDDSPVGSFEELVALAGLVWNAPTSCAWAARVYVNNKSARDHGLKSVGLPSRMAQFNAAGSLSNASASAGSLKPAAVPNWWWQQPGPDGKGLSRRSKAPALDQPGQRGDVQILNVDLSPGRSMQHPVCTLMLPAARAEGAWPGPRIRLALPSFSGGTPDHPNLIKYACDLFTNVRPVKPVSVTVPNEDPSSSQAGVGSGELMSAVLGGRPVLCLAFDDMVMTVEEPTLMILPSAAKRAVPAPAFGTVPPPAAV